MMDRNDQPTYNTGIEDLIYFMYLEPWTEKEVEIQAWILKLALESLD